MTDLSKPLDDLESPPPQASARLWAAVLALAAFGVFLFSLDFRTSGDSLVYADNIEQRRFAFVAVHYGYYAVVWALHQLVRPFVSVPVDVFIVYLNAVFGSAAAYVAFWLARELLGSTRAAIYTVVVLVFSARFFVNATSAEMYAAQCFFLLASFYWFLRGKAAASALSGVVALLVSPLSVFSFLFYPVTAWFRRFSIRYLVRWSIWMAVPYGLFLAVYYDALFWGERGLFAVTSIVPYEFVNGIRFFLTDLIKFFGPALLFAALGLPQLLKRKAFAAVVIAVYLPHVYVMFKQARADQLVMPTDFFLACICGLGLAYLDSNRLTRLATIPLLAGSVVLSGYLDSAFVEGNRQYADSMRLLYQQVMKDSDRVVIMKWFDRIAVQYYNTDAASRVWDRNPTTPHIYDEQWFDARPPRDMPSRAEIFVLEDYTPSRLSLLMRSEDELRARFEEVSLRRRVERDYQLVCDPFPIGILDLYRCVSGVREGARRGSAPAHRSGDPLSSGPAGE